MSYKKSLCLSLLLCSAALVANPAMAGGNANDHSNGELITPDKINYKMPETGINTSALPQIVLDANASSDKPLPYYRIGENTYMLMGQIAVVDDVNRGWNGNAGFVVTPEGVVVIDSLGTPKLGQRLIATVRSVTDKPIKYLVVTHNHPDHYYGAAAFRDLEGVTIIAHEATLEYNKSEMLISSLEHRVAFMKDDMSAFKRITPDVSIGGKRFVPHPIELGGYHFEIFNVGKHHSFGDLLVYQKEANIVWASDLVFNNRIAYMGDGNSKQAIEGQQWLIDTFSDAALIVPGHGSAQTAPFPMLGKTFDYMKKMRASVGRVLDDGGDLIEAVDAAVKEIPEWQSAHMYEHNHRRNANFTFRKMEEEMMQE